MTPASAELDRPVEAAPVHDEGLGSNAGAGTRSGEDGAAYFDFWADVGTDFPSLKGAISTGYYAECEQLLLSDHFPALRGKLLFKTDLWDEAKNSEILLWAARQGARVAGIDIAIATVDLAGRVLQGHRPRFAGGDVRWLPHPDGCFDLIYSMGTIEHFPEYRDAIAEIYRVLKPGGRAIIGVPNRWDPFLRPLMVAILYRLGLYGYGLEKSFSVRGFGRLLEAAGFEVRAVSGILFMPGWLRMAELWLHARRWRAGRWLGACSRPFAWLYRKVPAVRRHGYLIALVVDKPALTRDR